MLRCGRRRKQLLKDLKSDRVWKLKEEELERTPWRTRFGIDYGPVVKQTTNWTTLPTPPCSLKLLTVLSQSTASITGWSQYHGMRIKNENVLKLLLTSIGCLQKQIYIYIYILSLQKSLLHSPARKHRAGINISDIQSVPVHQYQQISTKRRGN